MGKLQDMKPVMAMIMLQFIYAGVTLFTRAATLQGMSPRVFVVYRHAVATVFIAPVALLLRRQHRGTRMGLKIFTLIFFASLIGVVTHQNLYVQGLYLASASIGSATGNLIPAITFVMASALGLEHVNIRSSRSIAKIGGTILCVGGAVIMAFLRGPKLLNNRRETLLLLVSMFAYGGSGGGDNNWILGCLFLFGSCCCWSIWLILQVSMTASYPDYVSLSAWICFLSTIQAAALTLFLESDLTMWIPNTKFQLVCIIYSGVIGSGIAFFMQSWCIARRGPVFSAMFSPLCTVIVTILAAIFLHEKVYTGSMAGAVGVVAGLYMVLWGKAEDVRPVSGEVKLPTNKLPHAVKIPLGQNHLERLACKIDLEEPFLSSN
ncbi:hypothetical protein SAY86_009838 [Trapa natans]|uniref:WAT1-related protein n=1 Tax=Trapa natans TaxID=22666 RepID=A0AAN7QTA4_TRANT|nr:hypothetical protein SAY86_009838 [Trapa natans]